MPPHISPDSPLARAREFKRQRKLTQVVLDHRARRRPINRPDYYEFIHPGGRGLSEELISIIAADIGVAARSARADYITRGGKVRKSIQRRGSRS